MYTLIIKKKAQIFIKKHTWESIIQDIITKFDMICKNPSRKDLDIKLLQWSKNKFRLRIWKYRFLYEVDWKNITVYLFDAWSRWNIYKK